MTAIKEPQIKVVVAKWIEQVAQDESISLYVFRVAQRLSSKISSEALDIWIRKLMSKADSAAIAQLIERGHLGRLQLSQDTPFKKKHSLLQLVCKAGRA